MVFKFVAGKCGSPDGASDERSLCIVGYVRPGVTLLTRIRETHVQVWVLREIVKFSGMALKDSLDFFL